MKRTFALAPGVGLTVTAGGVAARHFTDEYGQGPDVASPSVMALRVGLTGRRAVSREMQTVHTLVGGHRLARWRVRVCCDADASCVSCALQVAGPLGLPLVQSMVLEPLLSMVTPAAGRVLLPAALIDAADGPVLVLGPSGSGKSTLALRALAAGRPVAADDQVLLAADAVCAGLSRRLRMYGDLPRVVPDAHALLPAAMRRRLALAGAVVRLTGGRLSPLVPASLATLNPNASRPGRDMRPVRALLLASGRARAPVSTDELVQCALHLLAEQRARVTAAGIPPPTLTLERETTILESALEQLDAERIDMRGAADPLGALERPLDT